MAGHVLVCVTGQKTCEALIYEGARLAKENEAELTVLHVVKPSAAPLGNAKEGEALEYLFRVAASHDADMNMIRSDDVVGTIIKQLDKLGADVLVMGRSTGRKADDIAAKLSSLAPNVKIKLAYS